MTAWHSALLDAADEAEAAEALYQARRTDGLPIVVPTPARVEAMLLAGGLDGDLVLGTVQPAAGELTVEAAAVNAVMAGCTAEMFPLVIAACEALVDPLFDLGPMQSTTHCVTPLIIVNGPARAMFGMNMGTGAVGPGNRVNATLGRAIRLVMINVGGGLPGIGDMATLGSPAKYSCCLPEAEEESDFPPLHVSRGFAPGESTVTLLGVEGMHSLIFSVDDVDKDGEKLLATLAAGLANPASNNIYFGKGMVAVILNPLHTRTLARSGFTRESAQQRLFELATASRAALGQLTGANVQVAPADGGDCLRIVQHPADIMIFTGGAEGGAYSAYCPSWGGGNDGNHAVTRRVRFDEGCEIPDSLR